MNLEQIDTSTTAGKAEVMRLAAEGATVFRKVGAIPSRSWESCANPDWNWSHYDYAVEIGSTEKERFEAWARPRHFSVDMKDGRYEYAATRFAWGVWADARADLAGEGK